MANRTKTPPPERPLVDPLTKLPRYHSAEAQALPWPRTVPILAPADLAEPVDRRPAGDGWQTIWTWFDTTFREHRDPDSPRSLMREIARNELTRVQTEELGLARDLPLRCFALQHGAAQTALLWNLTMARLGYAVAPEKLQHGSTERRRGRG